MEPTVRLLRVRGIPIGVHWSWLLIFIIVVWSLVQALFPASYPGLSGTAYLAMGTAAAVLLFASVLAHEVGHALMAQRQGIPVEGITLWLFGGVARLTGPPPSPGADFRVAAAGPTVTAVLAAGFAAAGWLGDGLGWSAEVTGVAQYLARINLILLAFNLVPALPLDGGRVLRAWLWHRRSSFAAATRRAARAGQTFGFLLVALGLIGLLSGADIGGLWLAFVGWFIVQAAEAEAGSATLREALERTRLGDVIERDSPVVLANVTVADFLDTSSARPDGRPYAVVGERGMVGALSPRAAHAVPPSQRERCRVADVMIPTDQMTVIDADRRAVDAVAVMEGGGPIVMVMDGDRPVGPLSVEDLLQAGPGQQRRMSPRRRRAVWALAILAIVLGAAALYRPPYVVVSPGEAVDVATDITISGVSTDPIEGRYLLTSVRVSQPSTLGLLVSALRPDREVLPLSAILPPGVEPEEYARAEQEVFDESRMRAAAAAARSQGLAVNLTGSGARVVHVLGGSAAAADLGIGDVIVAANGQTIEEARDLVEAIQSRPAGTLFRLEVERDGTRRDVTVASRALPALAGGVGLGLSVETRDLRVDLPFDIGFEKRDIGGPSAGLAYALAIADLLSERDYAQGRTIAATGTIDVNGDVGPVGGIEQKAVAADEAGAELFVVPAGEAEEAQRPDLPATGAESLSGALSLLTSSGAR